MMTATTASATANVATVAATVAAENNAADDDPNDDMDDDALVSSSGSARLCEEVLSAIDSNLATAESGK